MKKISFYRFLLITLVIAGIYSCKDQMDLHQEYVKDGEIIYLSKFDSIVSYSGENRVQISGYLKNAYNVENIVVYWNNREDSLIFDYSKTDYIDSLNLIIPDLEEKSFIFEVCTYNGDGNRSIVVPIAGTAYGENYSSFLTPRRNNSFSFENDELSSLWLSPNDLEVGTLIKYTTNDDEEQTLVIAPEESSIVLDNRQPGTPVSYQSMYIPEIAAIDTFYTDWVTMQVSYDGKVDKSGWIITGFSTEEPAEGAPNGLATAAIDGDINTFWHSQWNGGNPGYPHWFSVDMGEEVEISAIEVFRRQGNGGGQTKHQFLYSTNGTDWVDYGTFDMNKDTNDGQRFSNESNPTARYIKYVALEGGNFYAFLGELNVYTPMD
ncbi:DUF4998 domain-containing protein [Sunxiuqinia sp. A32]|uniref:DUF4998 domain-containing protein n=1 Tax=Sunxiuqinia sp. A32 TaxID=3461496 RepID=UPI0040463A6A